jgi:hypothetical protein
VTQVVPLHCDCAVQTAQLFETQQVVAARPQIPQPLPLLPQAELVFPGWHWKLEQQPPLQLV